MLATLALGGCNNLTSITDPDFDKQYITLPSGEKAYCNRQGYREIRVYAGGTQKILVRDPNGNLVGCDAKVGPPWDAERVDEDGNLITLERWEAIQKQRMKEYWEKRNKEDAIRTAQQGQNEARIEAERQARIVAEQEATSIKEAEDRKRNEEIEARRANINDRYQQAQEACSEAYNKVARSFVPRNAKEVQDMNDLANQVPKCNESARQRYQQETDLLEAE